MGGVNHGLQDWHGLAEPQPNTDPDLYHGSDPDGEPQSSRQFLQEGTKGTKEEANEQPFVSSVTICKTAWSSGLGIPDHPW
jgi:hypothetical protein